MSKQRQKALIFTTIQGHSSIAEAVGEALSDYGWDVQTASFADPLLAFYRFSYRYAPWVGRYYYKFLLLPGVSHFVAWYTRKSHRRIFSLALEVGVPDVIIGTSYGFDALIIKWKQKQQKLGKTSPPFINIVVDPRTFFPINVCDDADLNCVFDQQTKDRCFELKPIAKTSATGWFVRKRFHSALSKVEMRKQLGLDPKILTLLFVAGSEGEVKSAKLIPELLALKEPVQIVLACGSNAELKQQFDQLISEIPANSNKKLLTLPFTKDINLYMRAADLMIGKAGPNTIFEAVATDTPFFAVTHIAGQEDGNLELIREYNIGYVEEDLVEAQKILTSIVNQPKKLEQFSPHLKKLTEYNGQAGERLVQFLSRDLNTL